MLPFFGLEGIPRFRSIKTGGPLELPPRSYCSPGCIVPPHVFFTRGSGGGAFLHFPSAGIFSDQIIIPFGRPLLADCCFRTCGTFSFNPTCFVCVCDRCQMVMSLPQPLPPRVISGGGVGPGGHYSTCPRIGALLSLCLQNTVLVLALHRSLHQLGPILWETVLSFSNFAFGKALL